MTLRILVLIILLLLVVTARAQHVHPAADMQIHEQFYSTWFMPDQPTRSCCNMADCYPTLARFQEGHWFAQRREDGKWLFIPDNKVERNRDNPDGRSHLCAPKPNGWAGDGNQVYCFTLGTAS